MLKFKIKHAQLNVNVIKIIYQLYIFYLKNREISCTLFVKSSIIPKQKLVSMGSPFIQILLNFLTSCNSTSF